MNKRLCAVVAGGALALVAGLCAPPATAQSADDGLAPKRELRASETGAPALAAGVIVKYRAGALSSVGAAAAAAVGEKGSLVPVAPRTRAFTTELMPLAEAEAAAAELAKRPDVEWAEPNAIRQAAAQSPWPTPINDPNSANLRNVWDMRGAEEPTIATLQVTPWPVGGYSTKAPALWPAASGAGVVVAVLDTGILPNHPDLAPNLVAGYDMIANTTSSGDGDGRDADPSDPGDFNSGNTCGGGEQAKPSSWHGSHVAGIIAAAANNGQGIAGIAPGAKVQPLRVLGRCGGADADIASAIMWAAGVPVPGLPGNPTPARVINMSIQGNSACPQSYSDAINAARAAGTTVVTAAGNNNTDAASSPPGNCPGVVNVLATSEFGDKAAYSNFGAAIDIAAPGGDKSWKDAGGDSLDGIYSTVDAGATTPTGPSFTFQQGTSQASPAVAGAAALLSSVGAFTPDSLEAALKAAITAFPTAKQGFGFATCNTQQCGAGIIDLTKVPAPVGGPSIAGTPLPGQTLTAAGGAWIGPATAHGFTWLANGQAVGTGPTYVVSGYDIGKQLVVRDSVTGGPFAPIGANSAAVVVAAPPAPPKKKKKAKLKVSAPSRISFLARAKVKVTVKIKGKKKPTGKITIKDGKNKLAKKKLKAKKKGKLSIVLPRLSVGRHRLTVTFAGSGAKGKKKVTITVTKRRR